jgi:hypothetical protein
MWYRLATTASPTPESATSETAWTMIGVLVPSRTEVTPVSRTPVSDRELLFVGGSDIAHRGDHAAGAQGAAKVGAGVPARTSCWLWIRPARRASPRSHLLPRCRSCPHACAQRSTAAKGPGGCGPGYRDGAPGQLRVPRRIPPRDTGAAGDLSSAGAETRPANVGSGRVLAATEDDDVALVHDVEGAKVGGVRRGRHRRPRPRRPAAPAGRRGTRHAAGGGPRASSSPRSLPDSATTPAEQGVVAETSAPPTATPTTEVVDQA